MNSDFSIGRLFILLLPLLIQLSPSPAEAGEWLTSVNAALGFKVLDQDQWGPRPTTGEVAIMGSIEKNSWPLALSLDMFYSKTETLIFSGETSFQASDGFGGFTIAPYTHIDLNIRTWEIDLGVKKIWRDFETVRPYLNGGLSLIGAEGEMTQTENIYSNNGTAFGLWAGLGANLVFNESLNIAFEVRRSEAKADMTIGPPVKIGGMHYHFIIGGNW
ncbi:MAG: hypothetical protein KKB30_01320 [Proteobacteria bacterium]|nr:hypothetical protein [Pseudomonadota bacterium]MBU1714255.1 hypothetical protein [Pseudomonadota bacterium]